MKWCFQGAILLAAATIISGGSVLGYESYHDPNLNDAGYCATCHPGFSGGRSDTLHALHTGGTDPVTQNCNLCHTGTTRDNPLTMWSVGDANNGLGCAGCHGNDYGETVGQNYRGFPIQGQHKNSGYGLRRHHRNAGVTVCATCHTNDVNHAPYPENIIDPGLGFTTHYYLRADVSLGGKPVNPCTNEHTANNTSSTLGLDNDGDGVYGPNDPDCSGAPPRLQVTLTQTSKVILSWPASFDGWSLERSPITSNPGASWTKATDPAVEETGFWRIVLPLQTGQFYRLTKQPLR